VQQRPPDLILLDVRLPDTSGVEVYQEIRAIDPRIPVVFITTAKNADTAIEAIKLGAFDYLHKPLDLELLRRIVGQALEVARLREPLALDVTDEPRGAMLGSSREMLEIFKAVGRVAAQDVTVLVTGESGTGKELVARAIHHHSGRAKAPFLALNCAAIPESLLESELFGHERGAFTGADRRRIGRFEQCAGGTLLLDEIGDMPPALQAKILRVLQERAFERLGGTETIATDVRVIAATHRDLKIHPGFRQDLYYRLGGFTIHLPPLRARGDDLPALVEHYVHQLSRELGREITQVSSDALDALTRYAWPGNIRELQNVIRQALLRASGTVLLPGFLPPLQAPAALAVPTPAPTLAPAITVTERDLELRSFIRARLAAGASDLAGETHRIADRMMITEALELTRGNHRDAARALGISRQTLRMRMRALGLQVGRCVESDDEAPALASVASA